MTSQEARREIRENCSVRKTGESRLTASWSARALNGAAAERARGSIATASVVHVDDCEHSTPTLASIE